MIQKDQTKEKKPLLPPPLPTTKENFTSSEYERQAFLIK